MKVQDILSKVDGGDIALPEFQRGYVWNREQVRGLMRSFYLGYPVGSLLVWETSVGSTVARGGANAVVGGSAHLLLDGQQRITSLYGIIRGHPPAFFEGDEKAFLGLHFHLDDEMFEFYAPAKMSGDPRWVRVTELMQTGVGGPVIERILQRPELSAQLPVYLGRLNRIAQIKEVDLHVDEVTGEDKTIDVVVDIFNRVNSGGSKLSKGDLALAKVCADWPPARQRLRELLGHWSHAGFDFTLDWLLRVTTTIITNQAMFSGLRDVDAGKFEEGVSKAGEAVDYLLNLLSARLGIDHDRVLGGRYAFPVMARYVIDRPTTAKDPLDQGKLLYWYLHSSIWGRFAGSTETVLNQDLTAMDAGGLDQLIAVLEQSRGDLTVRPSDFAGTTLGARFYPLLYVLTRTHQSRDLAAAGLELRKGLLGKLSHLEVHHIFPKAVLYDQGYERGEVNAVANLCFLTQEANLEISDREPRDYFSVAEEKFPGALESQWIPTDRELRSVSRYRDFLEARRELLTKVSNSFLGDLLIVPASTATASVELRELRPSVVENSRSETPSAEVQELVEQYGLAPALALAVISNPLTGEEIGIADAAWLSGLQGTYDEPVVLTIDPDPGDVEAMEAAGYRVFTSLLSLASFLAIRSAGQSGSVGD